ncbi:MAG: hypothetical protein Ct9H300mP27_04750 [Chloroflexota bacterium]|nr:MAG: hypothetical protein Ct9H300mP27_04750 [Chloroflexota bacterium]
MQTLPYNHKAITSASPVPRPPADALRYVSGHTGSHLAHGLDEERFESSLKYMCLRDILPNLTSLHGKM